VQTETPAPPAATVDARDTAVDGCLAALRDAPQIEDITERGASVARACGALYAEAGCREAYASAWAHFDPSQRSRIMMEGCRAAYCPKLPPPRPGLCEQAEPNLITARTTWPEFVRVVLAISALPGPSASSAR
jgi:hypothetical protein